jgi:hypothetical protein
MTGLSFLPIIGASRPEPFAFDLTIDSYHALSCAKYEKVKQRRHGVHICMSNRR